MSMESAESQGGVAAGELRQFIERVERLEEEKAALQDNDAPLRLQCCRTRRNPVPFENVHFSR